MAAVARMRCLAMLHSDLGMRRSGLGKSLEGSGLPAVRSPVVGWHI